MNTLIFSTKEEAPFIQVALGGRIFSPIHGGTKDLLEYLEKIPDAIAIIVGTPMTMGWSTHAPTHVLFSANYPKNPDMRTQAKGRVRGGRNVLDVLVSSLKEQAAENHGFYDDCNKDGFPPDYSMVTLDGSFNLHKIAEKLS